MLTKSISDVDPEHQIVVSIGGVSNNTRVDIDLPAVVLSIPSVATQQVMSTTINFTAQGTSGTGTASVFEIGSSNEATLTYYTPTPV
jgi:hypothetical protein